MTSGRDREIAEIVRYLRAAQVGHVFLGEADGKMDPIFHNMVEQWPRRHVQAKREEIRSYLKHEVLKFCRSNFPNLKPIKLAELYEPLFKYGHLRMSLVDFRDFVGGFRAGVFRGAPLHATVDISVCWGLQTEFPEEHLIKDLAVLYNEVLDLSGRQKQKKELSCAEMKQSPVHRDIVETGRRLATSQRMCVLACFNLIEAYINGISWEFTHSKHQSSLSKNEEKMLLEADGSIIKRLIHVPRLVSGVEGPLKEATAPLSDFIETIKPYRDSIVHASPYAAPEKFGGYEKLEKLYELRSETVTQAVEVTIQMIAAIHKHIGGTGDMPPWFMRRFPNGSFDLN